MKKETEVFVRFADGSHPRRPYIFAALSADDCYHSWSLLPEAEDKAP